MRQLLLFTSAAVIGAAVYLGVNSDKKQTENPQAKSAPEIQVKKSQATEEVVSEANNSQVIEDVLNQAAVAVVANKSQPATEAKKKPESKVVKPAVKTVTNSTKKVITVADKKEDNKKEIQDEVSTGQASAVNQTQAVLPGGLNNLPNKKIIGNVSMLASTDFKEVSDETKAYGTTFGFGIGYRVRPQYILRLRSSIAKDLSGGFEERLNNTTLSLSHLPMKIADKTLLIPIAGVIYPTNKDSKVRDEMHGGVSLTPVIIQRITAGFSLRYVPTVVARSHKFTTTRVGTTNNQYTAQQTFGADYMFTDQLSVGASYTFVQNWSYSGRQKDYQYTTDISSSYFFRDLSSFSVGINTGGLLYEAERGPDSNVEFYDPNSTSFYMQYGITL